MASDLRETVLPHSKHQGSGPPGFVVGARDGNSGLPPCIASTLPIELSPYP